MTALRASAAALTCRHCAATTSRRAAVASASPSALSAARAQRHAAWARRPPPQPIRWHSTHASASSSEGGKALASDAYTSTAPPSSAAATHTTPRSLSPSDRASLESMLRVDHAGEIAANTIYRAQASVFGALGDARTKQMMLDMWSTERKHLAVAEKLLHQHRTRPSALLPLWSAAGTALGAATALMGKEAAMACTEAVETVIGEHYDDQLRHLSSIAKRREHGQQQQQQGEPSLNATSTVGSTDAATPSASPSDDASLSLLSDVITEFRDDELEHLDTAVEHDAQQAPAHALLSAIIGWGCKGAIQIAKRI